jgi:hypothetical protein
MLSRQLLALALPLTLLATGAVAQPPPGGGRHHGPPPPAAFDACNGKKADDACEVKFGEHTAQGKCVATPDKRLACRPEPPPEVFKACEGKNEGDACSVQRGDHSFEGTCHKGPAGRIGCRPGDHR